MCNLAHLSFFFFFFLISRFNFGYHRLRHIGMLLPKQWWGYRERERERERQIERESGKIKRDTEGDLKMYSYLRLCKHWDRFFPDPMILVRLRPHHQLKEHYPVRFLHLQTAFLHLKKHQKKSFEAQACTRKRSLVLFEDSIRSCLFFTIFSRKRTRWCVLIGAKSKNGDQMRKEVVCVCVCVCVSACAWMLSKVCMTFWKVLQEKELEGHHLCY